MSVPSVSVFVRFSWYNAPFLSRPAIRLDAPVAAGLTPHLRCAGAILTLRDGGSGFTTSRMRTCRPGKTPPGVDHWALGTRTWGQLFHI